jgi:hypothetical protein
VVSNSFEQSTAEALQILKKSETQSLATGGKNAGDPNKLTITFYGSTTGLNITNSSSAQEFVAGLKTWGASIQSMLEGTHSQEEIDKVRTGGLLSALEEARMSIARNQKSGLGHAKLDLQKLLVDVPAILGEPPVTAGTWGNAVQKIEEAYVTKSNKKDMLEDFQSLKQTSTVRLYFHEFASRLSALVSADPSTIYKDVEHVLEAFISGMKEVWRIEQYRGDTSIRTLADLYKKLKPVMEHEESGKPVVREAEIEATGYSAKASGSDHSRGSAAIQNRLGPVIQRQGERPLNTYHVMAFRRLGNRCGRCGGPHAQWANPNDPSAAICPLSELDKKDARVLAANKANDRDRELGIDHSKAQEYIIAAESIQGLMPKRKGVGLVDPAFQAPRPRGDIPSRLSGSNAVQMNPSTKN